jgi:outer membrane receptor protein involved in Fe transport
MRNSALLLASAATLAITTPGYAQTTEEDQAQAANTPGTAQTGGDEIVVTATKRASRIQDVPFSINAQTEEDIQRANATTIEDISRNVAGLSVQNLGPGQSTVAIRGVSAGQIVRDQPGVKEQVGVYLDESVISLSLFTPDLDLYDLNRVETLRGPQGTLFGSGSVGGTLRYITNQPELGRTEGSVEANVNTVDEGDIGYHLKGAINVPLGQTAAMRVVGYGTHYAGFIDAIGPAGGKNVNDGNRVGGRVALLWEPTPGIKLTPRVVYQKVTADGFNRQDVFNTYHNELLDPPRSFGKREQYLKAREEFRDKTWIGDLTASAELGSNLEITSVTSLIRRNILVARDASALTGSVGVSFIGLGVDPDAPDLTSVLVDRTKLKQWTQELRLGSTGEGPFQWVLGGFYSHVDRKYSQRLPTPGFDNPYGIQAINGLCILADLFCSSLGALPGGADNIPMTLEEAANGFPADSPYNSDLPYKFKQSAIFGEASYDFGQFKVTAGGRYYSYKEDRDFISGGVFSNESVELLNQKTKATGFSPRAILTYEPNRNFSLNAQIAKGFRLRGINDPINAPLCDGGATGVDAQTYGDLTNYDDETLWNYELGAKYSVAGMTLNAAVFHNQIKDLQVAVEAGSCSSRVIVNAPKAHSTGIEAEFSASPLPGLDLSLAGSLINAKFDSNVRNTAGAIISGIEDGNRLPTVPKFSLAASATYGSRLSAAADWYTSASVQHISGRFTRSSDQVSGAGIFPNAIFYDPDTGESGTGLFDFGSMKLPSYQLVNLSAGVKWDGGLEVSAYVNNLFDTNPKISIDRERGGRARLGYNVGTPRTIGLTLRHAFGSEPAPAYVAPPPPPPPPPPAAPATQTCGDGSVILATDACPAPPPPPPPPAPEPERG